MMRLAYAACFMLLFARILCAQATPYHPGASGFDGPKLVLAGELNYPPDSVAYGTVVLQATIDDAGRVEETDVVCDVASLTPAAREAVSGWRFRPATFAGKPVRSQATKALVFNPALDNPPKASLTCLPRQPGEVRDSLFSSPRVLQVIYPRYPIQSVAQGTVVLELTVNAVGKAEAVKTVRDIASLTSEAVDATKGWKFEPAALNGAPGPSTVLVAILFRQPLYPDTR